MLSPDEYLSVLDELSAPQKQIPPRPPRAGEPGVWTVGMAASSRLGTRRLAGGAGVDGSRLKERRLATGADPAIIIANQTNDRQNQKEAWGEGGMGPSADDAIGAVWDGLLY